MPLVLPHIERMSRYPAGKAPKDPASAVKLNQNESPYPPSPMVLAALHSASEALLRRYPDEYSSELRLCLGVRHGVPAEQVFCGNGSSEIISLVMKVFAGPGSKVALPDPTFGLYHTAAAAHQAVTVPVPTDRDFNVDTEGLLRSGADLLVLVNPNAPTGKLLKRDAIGRLAGGFQGLVVVDEAYMDFADTDESALPLLAEHRNLLVLRTFSKAYGLCGARVGYAVAAPEWVRALDKGKDLYNINAVSARLAAAALTDGAYTERTVRSITATRERFAGRLQSLGFGVIPSQANFLLCTPPVREGSPDAYRLYGQLEDRGIYVRYLEHPRLTDKLRISIGTDREMDVLASVLEKLIKI